MNARIVLGDERSARPGHRGSAGAAWRSLGWFGIALAAIGLGQAAIYFVPPAFGSPEWEFGTLAQVLGSLPLPTMGLAAMLAAAVALGARRSLVALAVLLAVLGLAVLIGLAVFWSVVPMAVRGAPEMAAGAIRQTVARSTLSGLGFGLLYLFAAVVAVRQRKR